MVLISGTIQVLMGAGNYSTQCLWLFWCILLYLSCTLTICGKILISVLLPCSLCIISCVDANIYQCNFFGNVVNFDGGALVVDSTSQKLAVEESNFTYNSGNLGGAIFIGISNFDMIFYKVQLKENSARSSGGAIYRCVNIYSDNLPQYSTPLRKGMSNNYFLSAFSYFANRGVIFSQLLVERNGAENDGGGIYIGAKHSSFAIVDDITEKSPKKMAYEYDVSDVNSNVLFDHSDTRAQSWIIVFAELSNIRCEDTLSVYDADMNILYETSQDEYPYSYPGVDQPSLMIPSSKFYVKLSFNTKSGCNANDDILYGFELIAYAYYNANNTFGLLARLNKANLMGGGVVFGAEIASPLLLGINVTGNIASFGAGVSLKENSSFAFLKGSTFSMNQAIKGGGLLLLERNIGATIIDARFISNYARIAGPAIHIDIENGNGIHDYSKISVMNTTFVQNVIRDVVEGQVEIPGVETACHPVGSGGGGAISLSQGNRVVIQNCSLMDNAADDSGGAMDIFSENYISIADTVFINNNALLHGGAINSRSNNTLHLSR